MADRPAMQEGQSIMGRKEGGCYELDYGTWHVHVAVYEGRISVEARRNCQYGTRRESNIAGWTWRWWLGEPKPSRVDRAVRACWKWCDRRNARVAAAEQAAEAATRPEQVNDAG